MTLYTTLTFGDLASLMMLDNRKYRSDHACQGPEDFGGRLLEDCAEREREERSMLGPAQERWLRVSSPARPRAGRSSVSRC
jgi:alkaline phosphatase D